MKSDSSQDITEKKISILSLFDGISAGQLALQRSGIMVANYFASEIDKYSIAVTQYNFPATIQMGDVTKVRYKGGVLYSENHPDGVVTNIDMVIGGSPCQGFSVSGAGLAFDDPRSKLYFEFERILKEINPKYWLLENVPMKKEHENIINYRLGTYPIKINSALVSAQSRKRLYWTNIGSIPQPTDKKIYLQNIIESVNPDSMKSYCVDANYFKGGNVVQYFEKSRRQLVFDTPNQIGYINKNQQGMRVYSQNGKSTTISALGGGWGAKTGLYILPVDGIDFLFGLEQGRRTNGTSILSRDYRQGYRIHSSFGKAETLLASNKGGIAGYSGAYAIQFTTSRHHTETNRDLSIKRRKDSIMRAIESGELVIRKLTPIECERLQTVPDDYTAVGKFDNTLKPISNSQRYKMLGNSWTVDVITHIFNHIGNTKQSYQPRGLFDGIQNSL